MSDTEREALEAGADGEPRGYDSVWRPESLLDAAVAAGVLAPAQADLAREAAAARRDAIEVDSFTLEDYLGLADAPPRMAATA